jgi:hypothetical protein
VSEAKRTEWRERISFATFTGYGGLDETPAFVKIAAAFEASQTRHILTQTSTVAGLSTGPSTGKLVEAAPRKYSLMIYEICFSHRLS